MATIINTPPNRDTTDSGAGWAIAVITLLAVIGVGTYLWVQYRGVPAADSNTNINVTIPKTVDTTPGN